MFLKNSYALPLFDTINGGPPRAFECLVERERKNKLLLETLGRPTKYKCGKICRTEEGMKRHIKQNHGIEVQGCLYSMEPQGPPSQGEPRSLRIISPSPENKLPNQQTLIDNPPLSAVNPESSIAVNENEGESPNPISGEIPSEPAQSNQNFLTTVITEEKETR